MKYSIIIAIVVLKSISGFSQDTTDPKVPLKKNAISFNLLGTIAVYGVLYERVLSNKISAEAGIGIVGGGIGLKYYFWDMKHKKPLLYIGLTTAYSPAFFTGGEAGIGGDGFFAYIPIGISYFGKKRLNLGLDVGAGSTFKKYHEKIDIYPYGNFRIGFRF